MSAEGKYCRSWAKKSTCDMLPFIHNSRKWKQVSPQWQKDNQWLPREGRSGQEELQRGTKKHLAGMDMVIILTMVMNSQVYTYVKADQIMHFLTCVVYFMLQSLNKHRLSRKSLVFKQFLSYFFSVNINLPNGEGIGRPGYLLWQGVWKYTNKISMCYPIPEVTFWKIISLMYNWHTVDYTR